MVWSVWGRVLVKVSVMSVTAWNFCQLPLLVPEDWSVRKNSLPSASVDYHLLSCKCLVTSTLSSTVCTLLWQSAYPVSAVHFPSLYLEGCWEREVGDRWCLFWLLTLLSLHSLSLYLAAEWKHRWKHAFVFHCPFELMLGIALEALLSWKVLQFHLHCNAVSLLDCLCGSVLSNKMVL